MTAWHEYFGLGAEPAAGDARACGNDAFELSTLALAVRAAAKLAAAAENGVWHAAAPAALVENVVQ